MKKIFMAFLILFISTSLFANVGSSNYQRVKNSKTTKNAKQNNLTDNEQKSTSDNVLTIAENEELTFPAGLTECRVFDSRSLEKAILQATWKGTCEWIVLRSASDYEPGSPLWLQMDKPIVLQDNHPNANGHPLIITNDSGRAIIIKAPKNNGCAVIINKPNVAILGFTFEGAVCH